MAETQKTTGTRYALPPAIAAFAGEINDIDTHDVVPIASWTEEFSPLMAPLRDACLAISAQHLGEDVGTPGHIAPPPVDDASIDVHNVWHLKMEKAPGGINLKKRIEVADFVGVKRQIMFPGAGPVFSQALLNKADDPTVFKNITGDRRGLAIKLIDACNDWVARVSRQQDRVRPTALLIGDTPDELYTRLKKLVDAGVRQIMLSPDTPPGGLSPADTALDKVWALAAEANCPILTHISISENFLKTMVWREAAAFKGWMLGDEFSCDPWTMSNSHIAVQNFVMTMVMGGVFERHPKLRFGCGEFTAHWIGPLADNMDRWDANIPFKHDRGAKTLSMKPSEYLRRNVRVSPFDFEPVGQYIDHFGIEEVYCYASDFPHHEGGKDPIGRFVKSLEGHSQDTLRKFFVENGKVLLPD
jgi:predicted TIM-barrel fold metal-dependent hydrolase